MGKQKICIIGGGLTGLVTAIGLSKLDCEIDLITGNYGRVRKSNRTVAISQSNVAYLTDLNISESLKKHMWACSLIKLYTQNKDRKFSEIFEFNNSNKSKKIFYMIENSKITQIMLDKVKKIKNISLIKNIVISRINDAGLLKTIKIKDKNCKYNLIIICSGSNSSLVKNHFDDSIIKNSYEEISFTTIIKHDSLKNDTARQVFLNNGILALLPISNTKTSVVLSVKKKPTNHNLIIKNKIKCYAKNYLKNINFATGLKFTDLNFLIRTKYYKERTLLFGDTLHMLHPFVGQGFNMTIRDLSNLEKILKKKMNLGLDIGSTDILSEFSIKIKPSNFLFSISVDLLRNSFSYNKLRDGALRILNKNDSAKKFFSNIADRGFKL